MNRIKRRWIPAFVAVCLLTPAGLQAGRQTPALWETDLAEGQRLFNELDYEHAVPVLTRAILVLEPMAAHQPAARTALVNAYGLRARSLFGLDDAPKAQGDFRALLALDPAYTLTGQISPRVVALFESVKKASVGALALSVEPADAAIEIDGQPATGAGAEVPFVVGEYAIRATRVGYKPAEAKVTVAAGETKQFSLILERVSSVVFVVTAPPDVEVVVDGLSRGRTVPGPLQPPYATVADQLGVAPDLVSQPLVLGDLTQGAHAMQFQKPCWVTEERRIAIEKPEDYREEPVRLKRAVATVVVESMPAGASVFLDGERRGIAPMTLGDVCEGTRTIEMRGAEGRLVRRIAPRTGETVRVEGPLKPAFALLPAGTGVPAGVPDRRFDLERALANLQQATVFVPSGREVDKMLEAQPMPPEWLAFDASRRPIGAAAALTTAARRDLSMKFARALDVQGIAAISQPTPGTSDLVITLLAAGSGEPDVLPLTPERVDSMSRAIARFDYVPALTKREMGIVAADVLNADGPIVIRVDPKSAAAAAGIKVGDVVKRVDGQPVADGARLQQLIDAKRTGDTLSVEVHHRTGTARTVQLPVVDTPRVISVADQSLLFNAVSLSLRRRLAGADPAEQPIIRLNLAVTLLRLGDFAGAREQLEAANLLPGPGISLGTQQYLLGLLAEAEGDAAAARKSFEAASVSGGLLTEDGPAIKALAERKLTTASGGRAVSAP